MNKNICAIELSVVYFTETSVKKYGIVLQT